MKLDLPHPVFADLPHAYLVGGSVRDIIRGAGPLDYDVTATGDPVGLARVLAQRLKGKVITLGKEGYNVHRVVSPTLSVDVTAAKGGDIQSDLQARDFTINAMACDLSTLEVIDPLGGVEDLMRRQVKMVAPQVFDADPARLVRAFRMAAVLGFTIAAATLQNITRKSSQIASTPGERIWAELKLIMECPDSLPTLKEMAATHLLFVIFPELSKMRGCSQNEHHTADVYTHTLEAFRAMESLLLSPSRTLSPAASRFVSRMPGEERVLSKLSILLHDIGKPDSRSEDALGRIHFYGHAGLGASMVRNVSSRLRLSNAHMNRVSETIRLHQRPLSLYLAQRQRALRPKAFGRFFRQCARMTPYILLHAIADNLGKGRPRRHEYAPMIDFFKALLDRFLHSDAANAKEPLITGNDVMEHFKIDPSPLVGRILQNVLELQIAGTLKSREQALQWVSDYLSLQSRKISNRGKKSRSGGPEK